MSELTSDYLIYKLLWIISRTSYHNLARDEIKQSSAWKMMPANWNIFFPTRRAPEVFRKSTKDMSYPFHRIFAAFKSWKETFLHVVLAFFCFSVSFVRLIPRDKRCASAQKCNRNRAGGTKAKSTQQKRLEKGKGNKFSFESKHRLGVFIKSLYIFYLLG